MVQTFLEYLVFIIAILIDPFILLVHIGSNPLPVFVSISTILES